MICFSEITWEVVYNHFLPYLSQFLLWKYRWEVGCWKPEGPGIPQHPSYLPGPLHPRDSERTCCHLDWEASCDHHPKSLPTRQTNKQRFFILNIWTLQHIYVISKQVVEISCTRLKNNCLTHLPVTKELVTYLDMTR